MSRSEQPVTLVTGAASGIGLAVTTLLCGLGRRVVAWDVDGARLAESLSRLRSESAGELRGCVVDVSVSEQVEAGVAEIEADFGPVAALAHVAGVLRMGSATTLSAEAWGTCLAINSGGVFNVTRAAVRGMVRRQSGAIVVVASNAAHTPRVEMAAYAASKAAAVMFTKCLGLEVARHGVRCNVVSPGSTDTPMQHAFWGESSGREQTIAGNLAGHRLGIPLGRIASAEDVAHSVLFLLSAQARHVTLQELTVDGGATL